MMLVMIDVIVMIIMMILLMMIMIKMMTSSSSGIGCVGVTACRVSPPPAESAMQYVIWIRSS